MIERDLVPIIFFGQFWNFGKVHRHDEWIAIALKHIGPAPFVTAGEHDRLQAQFGGELSCAARHQNAAAFKDHGHALCDRRRERLKGGIERRTFSALWMLAIMLVVFGVKVRVEHYLANRGDGTHQ